MVSIVRKNMGSRFTSTKCYKYKCVGCLVTHFLKDATDRVQEQIIFYVAIFSLETSYFSKMKIILFELYVCDDCVKDLIFHRNLNE